VFSFISKTGYSILPLHHFDCYTIGSFRPPSTDKRRRTETGRAILSAFGFGFGFGFFCFALALHVLAMRALVSLNIHKPAFGVANRVKFFASDTAMGGTSAFSCHELLLSENKNEWDRMNLFGNKKTIRIALIAKF
jgi:hypothetical protein